MPGLDPGIHVAGSPERLEARHHVDGRVKPGHDVLYWLFAFLLLLAFPVRADGPPPLRLPLDCRLGETCWIMNYYDANFGGEPRDYRCGKHTYHGHSGVDFAIRDRAAMDGGVPVLAVAAGTVFMARDTEKDGLWLGGGKDEVLAARRECGNRVVLDLGGGWFADYCHLRAGSVAVKKGDRIAAGQRLGLVGLSGMTEYPHVHLGVMRLVPGKPEGEGIDPFTGKTSAAACNTGGNPVFAEPIGYQRSSLFAAGFADHTPSAAELRNDARSPASLPLSVPVLHQWVGLFAAEPGTSVAIRLLAPDGGVLGEAKANVERNQALAVFSLPRRAPAGGWRPGTYRGEIVVTPPGGPAQSRTTTIELR
jgi:murein DD-endopeptidase MepM/ murein hydrolase activator NlpD